MQAGAASGADYPAIEYEPSSTAQVVGFLDPVPE